MKKILFVYLSISLIILFIILYTIASCYMQLKYSLDPLNLQDRTIEEIYEIGKRTEIRRLYFIGGYVITNIIIGFFFYRKMSREKNNIQILNKPR